MCQHKYLHELGEERWYLNALKYVIINYVFTYRKNKRARLKATLPAREQHRDIALESFSPGEVVRIKDKADIVALIDFDGKYKRCQFMDEMYQYCGKTYPVRQQVEYFYDAGLKKLCKCKDLYILEGMACEGKKGVPLPICSLNCNFFWHGAWLEKISATSLPPER
jgi:hypothetical protein